jgi:ABC-type multidrug transport system fused ATPase/permease subunit
VSTLRKIHFILTPDERKSAVALLGLIVIGMVLEMLGIGLVIPAIVLLTQRDLAASYPQLRPVLRTLGNPTQARLIIGGMLVLVAVNVIRAVFLGLMTWRQTKFAFGLQADLSQRLFATYLQQPYTFLLQRNSAQLIRNAITEVNQFTGVVILPAMLILTEGLVLLGMALLLLIVEPFGALIVVLVLGVAAWAFHRGTRARLARWGVARQHHEGLRLQHLQQGLGGAKEVKLLGREGDFLARYREHNVQSARVGERQITLNALPRLWLELLGVLGLAILVLTMLAQGRDMARIVPALGLFTAAAFRLMPSVNRILGAMQSIRFGLPSVDVLHDELKLGVPEPAPGSAPPSSFQTRIELASVSYSYPGAAVPALDGVSIDIHKGELVGFIGPSGSGKSTLVDVILGLLTPTTGQVTVDGQDIQDRLRGWQDQIGYVPQSIYLTDDTLRRNVAFGLSNEQIDDAAVQQAIKAAQLEEFVASLPDGVQTVVGERGVRLSGGQRQRIGVARALYHDPAVLVLDEATSALDTITERGVMRAVTALKGSKTILVVAHRLSTVELCGRLYRLEQGRVAAQGYPSEMLRTKYVI